MATPSTLEILLAAHRAELVAFVARRAGAGVSAEDVVQQVALQALAQTAQLRDARSGRAWLFRIARNVLADQYRAPASRLPALGAESATSQPDEAFACGCVLANLRHLSPEHTAILNRVVFDGASIPEVARALGISANAATVRVHRAREGLKRRLRAHCGTESVRACLDCICVERGCCGLPRRQTTQA